MTFLPEALREFRSAIDYYERRSLGLGERFIDAVESGFRQIQRSPSTWRCLRGDIRRFLVKTFPYGIVYACRGDQIVVMAIMHSKREPDYWLGRLRSLPPPPETET